MHGRTKIDRSYVKNKIMHIRENILFRGSDMISGLHESKWSKSFHEYRVLVEYDGHVHYSANRFSGERYFFKRDEEK